ncbi:hypothetical protein VN12_11635 [Pirellula sp. SH-Sr6A]|uniref:hypothetical protein n=1 Tax=Pirellula sp. SH-Sr6A TaxID=1632865 RepID=UPI00078BA097|nr:hypothetical protein [Pirellula sp. SH-Sr6A]AMV32768.1 hypothetical protein VN12_11635 [Pirellula sp. SH-Sr6A]
MKTLAQEAEGTGLEPSVLSQAICNAERIIARKTARAEALLKSAAVDDDRFWTIAEHWEEIPSDAIDQLLETIETLGNPIEC